MEHHKMIYITGANRGIGKYLFEYFVAEGARVVGTYNVSMPESCYSDKLTKVDVTNLVSVKNWIFNNQDEANETVLINCAGVNYSSFAHKADLDAWENVIKVNLIGTFNTIHCVLPIMRDRNYGRIINFSSVVGQKGIAGTSAYAASKSALNGLAKSIAVENGSKGITINNINLGYFDIGMIKEVPEKMHLAIKENIPNKSFGKPRDIVNTVNYIITTEYLNGASIDLSGGLV